MGRWALVSGPKGAGRARVLERIVALLRERGLRVGGFLQSRSDDGIRLTRLARDGGATLAREGKTPRAGEEEYCSFAFDPRGFELARRWVDEDSPGCDCLVLHEVGSLEAAGRGHHDAVAAALAQPEATVILSVRAEVLAQVVERFGLETEPIATLEVPVPEGAPEAFCALLAAPRAGVSASG